MKRDEQAINTKQRILKEAIRLFSTKGYDNTTMQDIMDDTGLSKGGLYHHFKSKQEILEYYTNEEQKNIANYLNRLVENQDLSVKEKVDDIIDFFITNDSMPQLTKSGWAEKIPFALLNELRNTLNVLSEYVAEILNQGNTEDEFTCDYPKEVAGVLLLLFDIWLDPIIVNCDYEEMCRRVDFIILFLEKFGTPIISNKKGEMIKGRLKQYYDK